LKLFLRVFSDLGSKNRILNIEKHFSDKLLAWTLFFAFRLWWQVTLFQGQNINQLALVNALTGWPATVLLLILSYLYGTWRLAKLSGPSVEEFRNNLLPPWQGQRRGF